MLDRRGGGDELGGCRERAAGIFMQYFMRTPPHLILPPPPASFTLFSHFKAQWTQGLARCTKETVVAHFNSSTIRPVTPWEQ